ncbi:MULTISPECIES: ATP-binding protein [Ramlibacter]|uniref:SpoIIE family protein phosphatase n=1 Tax=Ramlibacter pinisoli TaxID=2682844 RepID=A0A6N8IR99_9BURK|nr:MULTISPECIES: ATP-binding protein [Ramlibacter]MBA2964411.1 ATP-binding protein [Ramlibacter sp. CGMCC 1.13660]MVQ29377.1 SpoIIE family protein phosphatase [Ramlibacter pinisoli]
MEVITGRFHADFPMGDASRVGEARRHAAHLADECGLDEVEAGRLAIIVNELGNNLVRHATSGRLLLSARVQRREVEVIAIDSGPGIADLDRCLSDGFSTGGTPGTGLGAVRRLAQAFDIHSAVPQGTVVLARVRSAQSANGSSAICVGAVALAAPGETVCGDAWAFAVDGARAVVMVADGLGHGPDAAQASAAAVEVFRNDPMAAPRLQVERLHAGLRGTRGAAVTVMLADDEAGTVRTSGAGNVMGRMLSGIDDRTLLTQHGTAGVTIRRPDETSVPWPDHALVVACSDGIETRWKPELLRPVLGRDPAVAAAILARDHFRGRDDATVAVMRRGD